jgi:6-phosphogluconolactonase (cycloisomerase 2 family)
MLRRHPVRATVALAACLLAPAPAAAQQRPFERSSGVIVAPEGTVAYAADYLTTLVLRRDPATGALSFLDGPGERAPGGRTYELSPDGRALYVSGGSSAATTVQALLRNGDGTLRAGPTLSEGRGAHDLAFTSDGRTLFASEDTFYGEPASVHVIARDPESGGMTSAGRVTLPSAGENRVQEAYGLAVAPNDRFLYVGDNDRLHVFALGDGPPRLVQSIGPEDCSCRPESLAMSPDGTRLYTSPMDMGVYAVDPATGLLTARKHADFGTTSGWNDETHRDVVVSPDSWTVYMSERRGDVIHQARATAEGAVATRSYRNYSDAQGLDVPGALTISRDGNFLYASTGENYGGRGSIVVFRRDPGTGDLTFASLFAGPSLGAQRPDFAGPCTAGCGDGTGVTKVRINDGAAYTNDPDVTLTIVPGFDVQDFLIDNDGGMRNAKTVPGSADGRYAWTLQSTGPERLAKTVYVRSRGHGSAPVATDEIILDETRPTVVSAAALRRRLRVVARDSTSGVARLQLAHARATAALAARPSADGRRDAPPGVVGARP